MEAGGRGRGRGGGGVGGRGREEEGKRKGCGAAPGASKKGGGVVLVSTKGDKIVGSSRCQWWPE